MPYINPDRARPRLDPVINALAKYLLERTVNERPEARKYFFFSFLVNLYGTIVLRIEETRGSALEYADYQNLDGAFDCAWKAIARRWKDSVPLYLNFVDYEELCAKLPTHVTEEDADHMCMLIRNIVEQLDAEPRIWGGEVAYTMSEVANLFANTGRATPQELLDIAIAASTNLHFDYATTNECRDILRNGDTAGFKTFFLKFSTSLA